MRPYRSSKVVTRSARLAVGKSRKNIIERLETRAFLMFSDVPRLRWPVNDIDLCSASNIRCAPLSPRYPAA
jgi:hypothetical protein